jgi:hypothetical protein
MNEKVFQELFGVNPKFVNTYLYLYLHPCVVTFYTVSGLGQRDDEPHVNQWFQGGLRLDKQVALQALSPHLTPFSTETQE